MTPIPSLSAAQRAALLQIRCRDRILGGSLLGAFVGAASFDLLLSLCLRVMSLKVPVLVALSVIAIGGVVGWCVGKVRTRRREAPQDDTPIEPTYTIPADLLGAHEYLILSRLKSMARSCPDAASWERLIALARALAPSALEIRRGTATTDDPFIALCHVDAGWTALAHRALSGKAFTEADHIKMAQKSAARAAEWNKSRALAETICTQNRYQGTIRALVDFFFADPHVVPCHELNLSQLLNRFNNGQFPDRPPLTEQRADTTLNAQEWVAARASIALGPAGAPEEVSGSVASADAAPFIVHHVVQSAAPPETPPSPTVESDPADGHIIVDFPVSAPWSATSSRPG